MKRALRMWWNLAFLLVCCVVAWGQAPTAPAPSILRPAGPRSIERYLNIRSATAPTYSPVTDDIAYLTNVTGTNQVWKHPARGGYAEQLTFFDDRVQSVRWSPRGDVLLFTRDAGGNERSQLFLMDPEGETIDALTEAPKSIYQFGDFSRDGAWICYSSNERNERIFDVYVMELATRKSRRIVAGEVNHYAHSFSPDGRHLLVVREHSTDDNDLFLFDTRSESVLHLTPHTGEAFYRDMAWMPDGSGFYVATNQGRDKFNLAFYDLRQQKLTYVEDSNYDVDDTTGLTVDPKGRWLFYAWNEDAASAVRVRNLKTGTVELFRGLPRGVVSKASFNGDGTKVAFAYSSPGINSDVWVLQLSAPAAPGTVPASKSAGAVARQVSHSSRAGIPSSSFVTPEFVRYRSFDGVEVPAFFYLPQGAQKDGRLPAIVYVHGGPESQERPDFDAVFQYFLNRGYAILAPNIRGSAGFGRAYVHMDDYKKRPDAIRDVALAVDYLKSTGYVDARKIAVMGGSYGGFMALAQATMHPELWAAVVDIVGISNWKTFFANTGPWRRAHRASEYGDPEKDPEFMASISPINFVDRVRAPLIIIQGANDPRVPKIESDQMVEKLKARGVPVEYLVFADEGHGLAKRPNRIKGYSAIADFLDKHLKNAP
ncbi:MAG TPA: S9 family peptidase [Terriglobales bacterium]|nr:S9 family peptidase [Terriglobales bacterium]